MDSAGWTCLSVFIEISSENIWLLFLPLWPVPVKTPTVLSIAVVVLLLATASIVLLGHLLLFHCYLSMYPLQACHFTSPVLRQAVPWEALPEMRTDFRKEIPKETKPSKKQVMVRILHNAQERLKYTEIKEYHCLCKNKT